MNLRAWVTAFRDAFRSMTQSSLMSLASVATVAISLLVLSVVLLLAVNMEHWATTVEQQVEIKAYLCANWEESVKCKKQDPTEAQKRAILDQVGKMTGVKQVIYVTREQALERMKKEFGEQQDIFAGLEGDNPLSDMVEIRATEPSYVKTIAATVANLPVIRKVDYGKEWVDRLTSFTKAVRLAGIGLVVLLIVATVLTISNTIRLAVYARRREIGIMKLVGATDWYIRRPFMIEGIALGILGSVLAMGLTGYGYGRTVLYAHQEIPFLPVLPTEEVLATLTIAVMILGGVLGAVGSLISLRRFLKV